jgi:galactokinase
MHGETDHALLIDCAARDISSVPLRLADAGLTCLVVDTGEAHATAGPTYARRVTECRDAARLLGVPSLRHVTDVDALQQLDDVLRRRARHVVTENARVLSAAVALRRGDFASLGELMRASHASLRDDYEVSTPALDRVVATATASGALGARLTGAGMGGCALVLVEVGRERDVRDAVAGAFTAAGAAEPTTYSVTAGRGARVEADVSHAGDPEGNG